MSWWGLLGDCQTSVRRAVDKWVGSGWLILVLMTLDFGHKGVQAKTTSYCVSRISNGLFDEEKGKCTGYRYRSCSYRRSCSDRWALGMTKFQHSYCWGVQRVGPLQKEQSLSKCAFQTLRLEPPYTGVPRPFGPEIPKESRKCLFGPLGPECQKVSKSPKQPKKESKRYQHWCSETFLILWVGRPAKTFLRPSGDFGAQVRRLLQMGIATVNLAVQQADPRLIAQPDTCTDTNLYASSQ